MIKRLFLPMLLLLAAALPAPAAVPASVTRAVGKVNDAATVEVTCSINGNPASMTLSHPCFTIDLCDARVCFDGTTQWAYSAADSEVTIITPTPEELTESNPLLILRSLADDYSGAAVKGRPDTVRLIPRRADSEVAEVTVTFNPSTGWPSAMTVVTANGRADITGLTFRTSKTKTPASAFKFKAPRGTTVTDLR